MAELVTMNRVTIDPTRILEHLEEIFPDREKFQGWKKDKINSEDIPWIQTSIRKIPEIVNMLEIKHGNKLLDMGCGDGRILVGSVILADLAGYRIKAVGYEKRPSLVQYAREKVRVVGLEDRIRIEQVDILHDDLKELRKFHRVYMYLYDDTNSAVAPNLEMYLPNGAIVLSMDYTMPRSWEKYRVLSRSDYNKFVIKRPDLQDPLTLLRGHSPRKITE